MKKAGYLLILLALLLTFSLSSQTFAQEPATVSIDAPGEAAKGATFIARVSIANVTNLNAWNYDVVFSKRVFEVANVGGGEVGGMPVLGERLEYRMMEDGRLRVVNDVPGISILNGSGYLAEIEFRVIGEINDIGSIELRDGMLADYLAHAIPASWGSDLVAIVEPTISLEPKEGCQGKELEVVITGKELTGATKVSFGNGIDVDFVVNSDIEITANIAIAADAAPELRDVSVVTPVGTKELSDSFMVRIAPTVTSISPDKGRRSEMLEVVINGTNLGAATSVNFGAGVMVDEFTVSSDTEIVAKITIADDTPAGNRDVSVTTAECDGIKAGGFTVEGGLSPLIIALIVIAAGGGGYFGFRWWRLRREGSSWTPSETSPDDDSPDDDSPVREETKSKE
jgi:hypothetical protein